MAVNGAVDGVHSVMTDDSNWDPYQHDTPISSSSSTSSSASSPLYLGIDLAGAAEPASVTPLITAALAAPFDYALAPISYTAQLSGLETHSSASSSAHSASSSPDSAAPTISPLAFPSATFNTNILALLPQPIIDVLCSPYSNQHSDSAASLTPHTASHHMLECFDYYSHLGICTVFIAPPPAAHPSNARRLARCVLSAVQSHAEVSVVIQLVCDEQGYEFYMRFITACGHHRRIYISLILTAHLPPPALLTLIRAEQLHSITLANDCWITNQFGYPILPLKHKAAVLDLLDYCQAVLLRPDPTLHSRSATDAVSSLAYHQHYIHRLHTFHTTSTAATSAAASLPAMYRDYLQSPLQPLHDNLSNQTYEVFESDPVKYAQYGAAIQLALSDLSVESKALDKPLVVWVVGAGRGPLVWAVLKAAEAVQVKVQLVAFEKNKHALQTLHALYNTQWLPYHSMLTLQPHNILTYSLPIDQPRPHLLVSELLGSFGDNELSAECMDAACCWLVEGGVCIPERSVSYVVPVRNARIMGQLAGGGMDGREMPYVVQLHACERVVEEDGQACFVFAHPIRSAHKSEVEQEDERRVTETEEDYREERRLRRVRSTVSAMDAADETTYLNTVRTASPTSSHKSSSQSAVSSHPLVAPVSANNRHRTLRFIASANTALTGLAGYFSARLYRNIELSTYPPTHTPSLTSWFPLYFPLQSPVAVRAGDQVEVSVWRCVGEKRVWYEWCVDVCGRSESGREDVWLSGSTVHNAGGKAASIGL